MCGKPSKEMGGSWYVCTPPLCNEIPTGEWGTKTPYLLLPPRNVCADVYQMRQIQKNKKIKCEMIGPWVETVKCIAI